MGLRFPWFWNQASSLPEQGFFGFGAVLRLVMKPSFVGFEAKRLRFPRAAALGLGPPSPHAVVLHRNTGARTKHRPAAEGAAAVFMFSVHWVECDVGRVVLDSDASYRGSGAKNYWIERICPGQGPRGPSGSRPSFAWFRGRASLGFGARIPRFRGQASVGFGARVPWFPSLVSLISGPWIALFRSQASVGFGTKHPLVSEHLFLGLRE